MPQACLPYVQTRFLLKTSFLALIFQKLSKINILSRNGIGSWAKYKKKS